MNEIELGRGTKSSKIALAEARVQSVTYDLYVLSSFFSQKTSFTNKRPKLFTPVVSNG